MRILVGRGNSNLGNKIAKACNSNPLDVSIKNFADGEIFTEINDSIRGEKIYVIQSLCDPINNNLVELLIIIDALKRASASEINLVIPYFGYARQDRKSSPRACITAKLIADLLQTSGANRMLTIDLHSPQIQGFFNIPVDNLYAYTTFIKHIKEKYKDEIAIASPDAGGVVRARMYANELDCDMIIVDKRRPSPGESEVMHIIGDSKDKICIMIDDMIDSGGTICKAANELMKFGARSVITYATHGVLSGLACENIAKSSLEKVYIMDTIPISDEKISKSNNKINIISSVELLSDAIIRLHNNKSLSEMFLNK